MSLKRKYDATTSTPSTSPSEGGSTCTSGSLCQSCTGQEKNSADLTKKKKKGVNFEGGVAVYYFRRKQGFICIPSQGGITLGMTEKHTNFKKFSLQEYSAEQAVAHRKVLREQLIALRQASNQGGGGEGEHPLSHEALQDIDREVEAVDLGECYFLQPIPTKKRRLLLQQSGVKVVGSEKRECKIIQESREVCGCNCKEYCDPESCTCSLDGIKCQVDRLAFPCCCTKDKCGNLAGRIEFNPAKVRSHYIHTIMKLSLETQQQQQQTAEAVSSDDQITVGHHSSYQEQCLDGYQQQQQQQQCSTAHGLDGYQQHEPPLHSNMHGLDGGYREQPQTVELATSETQAAAGPHTMASNSRVQVVAQPQGLDAGSLPCVLRYTNMADTRSPEEDSLSSGESSCSGSEAGGYTTYQVLGYPPDTPPAEPATSFTDLVTSDLHDSGSLAHTLSTFGQLSRRDQESGTNPDLLGYGDKLFGHGHLKALVAVPVVEAAAGAANFDLQQPSPPRQQISANSSSYFGCHSESSNQSSSSGTSEGTDTEATSITTLTSLDGSEQTNFGEAIKNSILETVSV